MYTQSIDLKSVRGGRALGRSTVAVAVLAAAVSIGACGSSSSPKESSSIPSSILDTGTVERSIEQSIFAQRHVHAKVSCPGVVPQEKGRDFACIATIGKTQTSFAVTQVNDSGYVKYHAR